MDDATKNTDQSPARGLASFLPILGWIRTYDAQRLLRPDILAGLTIAAFAVPESMAYASLAGLAPEHGLYASMVAMLTYAAFGTSRQMGVGVTSALSIMVAGTLGALAFSDAETYLAAAQLTALLAGAIALIAGLLRLGFIVNFVSESVLVGFSAGAALFIASSQLSKLFGIEGVEGNFFVRIGNIFRELDQTNLWTLALGLVSLVLLLVAEERFPRLPSSLIVVGIAIALVSFTDLKDRGVAVAGEIPAGLPSLGLPAFPADQLPTLVGLAFGCFLLSYVEGISVAKTFAARNGYRIDADQELVANGAINAAAGIASGYPVGGSMSRSAVSAAAGAQTPLAGAIAAVLLAVVLLVLTGLFANLPETTLAAIVLVAVRHLVDLPALARLRRLSRVEYAAALLTMGGVLVIGMLEGILIGAIFSLLSLAYHASRPRISTLGRVGETPVFADVARHPENAQIPGVLIVRVDGPVFYADADGIEQTVLEKIRGQSPPIQLVVLTLESSPSLDLAGVDMLAALAEELEKQGVTLRLAWASGTVRDLLRAAGLGDRFGPLDQSMSVDHVIQTWRRPGSTPDAPLEEPALTLQ